MDVYACTENNTHKNQNQLLDTSLAESNEQTVQTSNQYYLSFSLQTVQDWKKYHAHGLLSILLYLLCRSNTTYQTKRETYMLFSNYCYIL